MLVRVHAMDRLVRQFRTLSLLVMVAAADSVG
jgi:hypothetical protein